ncbi:copper homeostasis periplasmic binding protein CopC [Pseudomonas sp. Fl4BN1]|uniref:copper homeostasis periplasmic binding protein CopC n=1 Tax=Pseudomonas sp. Fl4BN1 TaxID=2697651 RepID=UPI001378E8DD|nr:copper homeostasis periplasmic binding protein CopC [Pseudomonas sp. Fl4BN1]NBF07955.1 copper homeostasis periplasmic binding protein CopC [Pseudomonas sp. Fl4BN1]
MSFLKTSGLGIILAISVATTTQAHPKLLSSVPAEGAVVAAPEALELRFSEALTTQFSGARLLQTGMPGMSHAPLLVKAAVQPGSNPQSMLISPAAALSPGRYSVEWRAVSSDTHPITGTLSFSVK